MNEKKIQLMEAGLSLFSIKGYHATSIQEITDEANMSKGSFYLYFQSKEKFIVTAFQYFHEKLANQLVQVDRETGSPRESLAKQTTVLFEYISKYRNFILTYFHESILIGEQMETLIQHIKKEKFHWICSHLESIYEDQIEPFLLDIVIQFEGLLSGYINWLLTEDVEFDFVQAGAFLIRRMDDLVNGMITKEEPALVTALSVNGNFQFEPMSIMEQIYLEINRLSLSEKQLNHLKEVWEALQKEIVKEKSSEVMIQGLLVHFQQIPELIPYCEKLAKTAEIDLIGLE